MRYNCCACKYFQQFALINLLQIILNITTIEMVDWANFAVQGGAEHLGRLQILGGLDPVGNYDTCLCANFLMVRGAYRLNTMPGQFLQQTIDKIRLLMGIFIVI